jgi:hypothetical protein
MEQLNTLSAGIEGINSQIEELKNSQPIEPVAQVDPNNDPDNAPPESWKSLRQEIRTEAEQKAEEKLLAKEQEQENRRKAETEAEKEWDTKFEQEAQEAIKQGFIPEVKNADDKNDPGNVARRDLFGYAHYMEQTDLLKVADTVKMYNDQGKHFDFDSGKWIQSEYRAYGKTVPVGSSSSRVTSPNQGITYKELHGTSMDMLLRKAKAKYDIS